MISVNNGRDASNSRNTNNSRYPSNSRDARNVENDSSNRKDAGEILAIAKIPGKSTGSSKNNRRSKADSSRIENWNIRKQCNLSAPL
jgi:hypothetical protein